MRDLDGEDVDINKQQTAAVTDKHQQHHNRMQAKTVSSQDTNPTTISETIPLISPGNHIAPLWHRRLGHISRTAMERLVEEEKVLGLPALNIDTMYDRPCYECLAGRHIASPHHPGLNPPTVPLQLINIDITGPHVQSITHTPYSLNAIDYTSN